MFFEDNPKLNIISCEKCKAGSSTSIKSCWTCKDMAMGRISGEKFIYYGDPLSRYHISLRKAQLMLQKLRIMGALVFGMGSWALFAYLIYLSSAWEALLTMEYWIEPGAIERVLFWFGIISFSYLWYRLSVVKKSDIEMETGEYVALDSELAESMRDIKSWNHIKKIPKTKRVNIADFFTKPARGVLENAFKLADKYDNSKITPIHLFYTLLSLPEITGVFVRLSVSRNMIWTKLTEVMKKEKARKAPVLSPDSENIIFNAYDIARKHKDTHVRATELLIATVRQSEFLQEILYDFGIDDQKFTNVIEWVRIRERLRERYQKFKQAASKRSKHGMDRAMTAVATPYLNNYSQDLTMAAKSGHLSPCVARDKEIKEVFRVIEGGQHSVILVGQQGVGKMTIIEGIAQLMIEDKVPARLEDKRLVQISTSALLAGTTVSGAQERLIRIMNEVNRAGNIILFIKNLHDLAGMTDGQGEGLDVSETIAEYLGPGNVLMFATTTTDGFNKHILNSQIGKVMTSVEIREMDENQAIQVLESKAGSIEYKHHVFFSYDAIDSCVTMAKRFLHDQNLPESAMSLMAEVASHAKASKGEDGLVTAEDVGVIVGEKTGIPATSITEDESSKLLRLEEEMHKRVIGQDKAVIMVANALRRARAAIRSKGRPIANFLFLGPTGVGKTELAKTIASVYFGGEERMIRTDMSEYQDKSSIYRLIGQPHQQGTGLLTEAVRKNPFSLVLLDEMEKADPNVLTLFLQVFDDGRLTDSVGRVIDFTNTIIIATSNAGTAYVQEQMQQGIEIQTIRENLIRGELKKYYRPEFLNRFDGIILFKALNREEIKEVAKIMLRRVAKDLSVRGVGLRVEEDALEALADVGFDPEFGARPMRRAIQEKIEDKLAELILHRKLKRRDVVVFSGQTGVRIERAESSVPATQQSDE